MTGLLVLLACGQVVHAEEKSPRDGVFLHLSHGVDQPHRVLMALNMAEMMAESRDVLVYFDIEGIEVVLKNAPDLSYRHFPASRAQIEKLIGMGIGLYACPGCLKAAGRTPEDLMPGVKVADKDAFFNFTEGRILTLDY
jgi:predicted peroxiredoxin